MMKYKQLITQHVVFLTLISISLLFVTSVHAGSDKVFSKSQQAAFLQFVKQALQESGVPGVGIAIVKDGKVLTQGYGVKNIQTKKEVDKDTLFAIASNTKAFTAAAVGILVDRGKLNWDDKVRDHLNYVELYDPYTTQHMRMTDILSHRLGYKAFSGDLLWYDTSYTPEEIIKRARYVIPAGEFRYNFGYFNLGFIIAGEVVAQTAGKSWDDFIHEEIFKPLGMKNSATGLMRVKHKKHLASPHFEMLNEQNEVVFQALDWHHNEGIHAAGSIITSPEDISNWLQLQLNLGTYKDKVIFKEKTSAKMWTAHNGIGRSPSKEARESHLAAYGLGWFLKDYQGKLMMTHGGSLAGMTSRLTLIPEEGLGIAVLTNSTAPLSRLISNKIVSMFLKLEKEMDVKAIFDKHKASFKKKIAKRVAQLGPVIPNTVPSRKIREFAGTYRSKMYGDVVVSIKNSKMRVAFEPSPMLKGELTHRHYDVFTLKWDLQRAWINGGTAHFVTDAKGQITELKFNVPNDDIWFDEPTFLRVAKK